MGGPGLACEGSSHQTAHNVLFLGVYPVFWISFKQESQEVTDDRAVFHLQGDIGEYRVRQRQQ